MRTQIQLILLACLWWSCNTTPTANQISGTIKGGENQEIFLIGYDNGVPDTLQSGKMNANGDYSLTFKAGRSDFYTLAVNPESTVILIIDSTETDVKVSGDLDLLRENYEVNGSTESEKLKTLLVETTKYEKQLDTIMTALRTSATTGENEKRVELGNSYNQTREEYRNYLISFIENDPNTLANFTALQRLNMKNDLEYFIMVRDGLSASYQGNYFFDNLSEQIAKAENQARLEDLLKPGSPAPEIALPNPDGEMLKLSDYRGNYVLIDFWASWCKPCRVENPNVVRMYQKYADKNFEILGVSLDRQRDKWIQAIAQDKLQWPQVSDLKFWQSAAAELYNVKSIPFTVLVDPDGNVVATKLRGRALEEKLKEIFNA